MIAPLFFPNFDFIIIVIIQNFFFRCWCFVALCILMTHRQPIIFFFVTTPTTFDTRLHDWASNSYTSKIGNSNNNKKVIRFLCGFLVEHLEACWQNDVLSPWTLHDSTVKLVPSFEEDELVYLVWQSELSRCPVDAVNFSRVLDCWH